MSGLWGSIPRPVSNIPLVSPTASLASSQSFTVASGTPGLSGFGMPQAYTPVTAPQTGVLDALASTMSTISLSINQTVSLMGAAMQKRSSGMSAGGTATGLPNLSATGSATNAFVPTTGGGSMQALIALSAQVGARQRANRQNQASTAENTTDTSTTTQPAANTNEGSTTKTSSGLTKSAKGIEGSFYDDQGSASDGQIKSGGCGLIAAQALAKAQGKDLKVADIKKIAVNKYWNGGMKGPDSENSLLKELGVNASMKEGVNWDNVASSVQAGKPVVFSTPQHYWVAQAYDPATKKYNFGSSAKVVGANEWMTKEEYMAFVTSSKRSTPGGPTHSYFLN